MHAKKHRCEEVHPKVEEVESLEKNGGRRRKRGERGEEV